MPETSQDIKVSSPLTSSSSTSTEAWHITSRWLSYEGEIRCCVFRIGVLLVMYSIQLVNYYNNASWNTTPDDTITASVPEFQLFHRQVTWLAATWMLLSLATLTALRRGFFPAWLPLVTMAFDVIALTVAACLGSVANSPLVTCYCLLIAMAGLRASLPCVWTATLASILGYMVLVGVTDETWFDAEHAVPLVTQFVTLTSLVGTGVVVGQFLRMNAASAKAYQARIEHLELLPGKENGGPEG